MNDLNSLIRLSRPFDVMYPILSLFIGIALAGQLNNHQVYLLILVVALLNSCAMIWNDIEDKQIDNDNGRNEIISSSIKLIQRLKAYTLLMILLALIISYSINIYAFLLSMITVLVIWIYNSMPIRASRRPIMSIIILSCAGAFLPYILGLTIDPQKFSWHMLIAGLFWWFARMSLSVLKDYKDAWGDAKNHKKTFLLKYGARWVAKISTACLIIGYGGFILYIPQSTASSLMLAFALILGIGFMAYVRFDLFNPKATYSQLANKFRIIAQTQIILELGIFLWLI